MSSIFRVCLIYMLQNQLILSYTIEFKAEEMFTIQHTTRSQDDNTSSSICKRDFASNFGLKRRRKIIRISNLVVKKNFVCNIFLFFNYYCQKNEKTQHTNQSSVKLLVSSNNYVIVGLKVII